MKVTFTVDTDLENVDLCELEQLKHAGDMARALWELQEAILEWCHHPEGNVPLDADSLYQEFHDILRDNSIDLEKLYN